MKNNIKRKDNIKSVTLVIDAYDDRKLEIPLEVWQVDVICRMLGLSVDTANLDTYSMRSKEQVDSDMKIYYHTNVVCCKIVAGGGELDCLPFYQCKKIRTTIALLCSFISNMLG